MKRACDRCHRLKVTCDKNKPCNRCVKGNLQCSTLRPFGKMGRPKRNGNEKKYSHNGCNTCKERKQKCDEDWPTCLTCRRLNVPCSGIKNESRELFNLLGEPMPKDLTDLTLFNEDSLSNKERFFLNSLINSPPIVLDNAQKSPDEEEQNSLLSFCNLNPYGIKETEMILLRYFITDVSPILNTGFFGTIIPLSMEDEFIRYPILAIAASHRANAKNEFKREAFIFRAKSQSLFIANHMDYLKDSENNLLSILLLATQEIFEGDSLYWGFALEKAATIIRKRGGLAIVNRFAPLSVQLFCYLDLISSLSTCAMPYIDQSDFGGEYEEYNNKFGFKIGISGDIFKIIGNISTLSSLRDQRFKTKENERQFSSLATLIELKLQNLSPDHDFNMALQWAAFLRLHQICNGYNRIDTRTEACLNLILSSLKEILDELDTRSIFPLIMAGSVAYKADDRSFILSRIHVMKEKLKFSYLGEFERLILLVWGRDNEENHSVNWAKIRFFEYPGLVMF